MKINYELTKDDEINFNICHMENSELHKRTFNRHRYLTPLIFYLPIYYIYIRPLKELRIWGITIVMLFAVSWILRYPKKYRKMIAKSVSRKFSEGDNSSILGKKSLEIIDETLVIKGEFISQTVLIEGIKEIKIYKDIILIYISASAAHIIPRRYLDEEMEKQLIAELRRQMPSKK